LSERKTGFERCDDGDEKSSSSTSGGSCSSIRLLTAAKRLVP
jgi:hypothetical protein